MRIVKWIVTAAVVLAVVTASVWFWRAAQEEAGGPDGAARAEREARSVIVSPVELRTLERTVDVVGSLAASEAATVSVKVAGRLAELHVDLGDEVAAGEPIGQIEQRDYELGVRQAEAQLAQARVRMGMMPDGSDSPSADLTQLNIVKRAKAQLSEAELQLARLQPLVQRGLTPESELRAAEIAVEVAQTQYEDSLEEARHRLALLQERETDVEIARQRLRDTVVRAPFAGAVEQRIAGLGEFLSAGDPVVRLVRIDRLRLRVEVPERRAAMITRGQLLRFTVENDPQTYEATVTRLSPLIDEARRVLLVEADVDNPGSLRPGAFARGRIIVRDDEDALTVPRDAIASFAGVDRVFTIEDGKAAARTVTIGRRNDEWVEIAGGLDGDERVIRRPGAIQSGDPARVSE